MIETTAEKLANFLQDQGVEVTQEERDELVDEKEEETFLPELMFQVQRKGEQVSNISMKMTACIWGNKKLYYFEVVPTSDMATNALIAALTGEFTTNWFIKMEEGATLQSITPPINPMIADTRIKVPNWSKHVHHLSALDRSGEMILADRGEVIWKKMREIMTTPTLETWGRDLIDDIRKKCTLEARTYGIVDGVRAYVIVPESQPVFDNIISEYVKSHGLEHKC